VKDGRVVKGVNFVDLRDAGDPVQCAIAYDAAGADELCFLDITASFENRGTLLDVVRRTAEACFMPLTSAAACARWTISAICCSPAPIRFDQLRRRGEPRLRARGGGEIWRAMHRRGDRREAGQRKPLGDFHPRGRRRRD